MKLKPSRCGVSFLLLFFLSFTWGIALKDSPSLFWDLCTLQFKPREQTGTPHLEAAQYRGGHSPPTPSGDHDFGQELEPQGWGPREPADGFPAAFVLGGGLETLSPSFPRGLHCRGGSKERRQGRKGDGRAGQLPSAARHTRAPEIVP